MPIYEYRCKKCNSVSEFLVIGEANDSAACTACGSTALEKIVSVSNVHARAGIACGKTDDCTMQQNCNGRACCSPGCCRGE